MVKRTDHNRRASRPEDLALDWIRIPTLPQIVGRINRLLDDPEVGLREIGDVVAQDPPIASQVLRTANSALFGLAQPVVSLQQATSVLGARTLRNITLQASVMKLFSHLRGSGVFNLEQQWKHSILVAQMCCTAAFRAKSDLGLATDEFFVVGLLHDIGRFVMLDVLGDDYVHVLERARLQGTPGHVAEKERLGFHHAEVGAVVADHWKFPELVCRAIRYHHGPDEQIAADPRVALVANMNLLVERIEDDDLAGAGGVIDDSLCEFLGLSVEEAADLLTYASEIRERLEVG